MKEGTQLSRALRCPPGTFPQHISPRARTCTALAASLPVPPAISGRAGSALTLNGGGALPVPPLACGGAFLAPADARYPPPTGPPLRTVLLKLPAPLTMVAGGGGRQLGHGHALFFAGGLPGPAAASSGGRCPLSPPAPCCGCTVCTAGAAAWALPGMEAGHWHLGRRRSWGRGRRAGQGGPRNDVKCAREGGRDCEAGNEGAQEAPSLRRVTLAPPGGGGRGGGRSRSPISIGIRPAIQILACAPEPTLPAPTMARVAASLLLALAIAIGARGQLVIEDAKRQVGARSW